MGYFMYFTNEPKEPSDFADCTAKYRDTDVLFTVYEDGTATVKLNGYTIYPSEELPPDLGEWSWSKVLKLIVEKAAGPWRGRYLRLKRFTHYKLTGKPHLPSEEKFLENYVLDVMKETHPDLHARIKEWRED